MKTGKKGNGIEPSENIKASFLAVGLTPGTNRRAHLFIYV